MKLRGNSLMLIEISATCVFGSLVLAHRVARRLDERRRALRREQLLMESLQHTGAELPASGKVNLSVRKLEMELLLLELETAGERLTKALTAEAASNLDAGTWHDARRDVATAEENYRCALADYREFMHALPPPMQAHAAERGARVLAPGESALLI
ncbi:MAG TPA: hypothetical protein VMS37_35600 [Verrucomicrobiae bacterium]|nr:hypothetical protein [Verrucomicrobiae bacterium]